MLETNALLENFDEKIRIINPEAFMKHYSEESKTEQEFASEILKIIKEVQEIINSISVNTGRRRIIKKEFTINEKKIVQEYNNLVDLINVYSLTSDLDNCLIGQTIIIKVRLEKEMKKITNYASYEKILKKLNSAWETAFKLRDLPNEIFELASLIDDLNKKENSNKWDLFGLFPSGETESKIRITGRIEKLKNKLINEKVLKKPLIKIKSFDQLIKDLPEQKVSFKFEKSKRKSTIINVLNLLIDALFYVDRVLNNSMIVNNTKIKINNSFLERINDLINNDAILLKSCLAIEKKVHKEIIKELK